MNRRTALELLLKSLVLATPFSSKIIRAATQDADISNIKSVLIFDSTSASDYARLVEKAGAYLSQQDPHWRSKLVYWDIRADSQKIAAFISKYGPNTKAVNWPILIVVPENYDTELEVETWTLSWLRHEEGRIEDACYPVSGGWWSVDGDFNPSIQKVRSHCFESPNHTGGKFQLPWLSLLKYEELMSLHSDHHREMVKKGKVYWKNVNVECPAIL